MEVRWVVEAVLIAVLLFGLFHVERRIRVWRWQRARQKGLPLLHVDESTKGFTRGAAEAAPCGRCGKLVRDYFSYADGDIWCDSCDEAVS